MVNHFKKHRLTKTKYGVQYFLKDQKGEKEWRRLMTSKLKPRGLARDIQDSVTALDEEAKKSSSSRLH
jgi:hypothetical protein